MTRPMTTKAKSTKGFKTRYDYSNIHPCNTYANVPPRSVHSGTEVVIASVVELDDIFFRRISR